MKTLCDITDIQHVPAISKTPLKLVPHSFIDIDVNNTINISDRLKKVKFALNQAT